LGETLKKPLTWLAVFFFMQIALVFPHQIFDQHPAINRSRPVYLIEDALFFSQYAFHQQKIVLHRASMKYYQSRLQKEKLTVTYIEHKDADLADLFARWKGEDVEELHFVDPTDYLLKRRLHRFAKKFTIGLVEYPNPSFLSTPDDLRELFASEKKYFMASFYIKQRKRLRILVNEDDTPVGGQWSFDADNRKRIPKGLKIPVRPPGEADPWSAEAKEYVAKYFQHHYGSTASFSYPTSHASAEKMLEDFLVNRMHDFGLYEDAIVQDELVLFHSVLTPALNTGLLTPQQILHQLFDFHRKEKYPLNSMEGFVRQVIGWREFMRALYEREGVYMRKRNFWNFSRKLPASFYNGSTGIAPVDATIQKVLRHSYCHHIERLMILGGFMQLCEFDPDEVYHWFMELFIDAYDWVMVPNVYGMSQYADGGLITTKPYVSGSNYVLKMSNYARGPWCDTWDALYWRYIYDHSDLFSTNPRMSMVVNLVKKMDKTKLKKHLTEADRFLATLP
jgi:deoxyribodipyrimidine photolyase-related protein